MEEEISTDCLPESFSKKRWSLAYFLKKCIKKFFFVRASGSAKKNLFPSP